MTYEMIANKAKDLPEEKIMDVMRYIDYLMFTIQRPDIVESDNVAVPDPSQRIGIAKGKIQLPDDVDMYDDEVMAMFGDKL